MNHIRNLLFFCTPLLLCMTCASKNEKDTPLIMLYTAMRMVDNQPQEALELLEDIPFPEFLDQDSYMQYIVTQTQAQYMDYQDITNDSSILKVQYYFVENNNHRMAARASFYTAAYWDEKGVEEKALEYALLAHHYAQQANNNLFSAKAAQWIGSTYYDQDELDSAGDYYLQALELYTNEANTELQQLDLIYMLGRTYRELQQFDQALNYLNDGLEAALKLNNKLYQARFLNNLGIVFTGKKEYQQAKNYFDQALAKSPDTEDIMRINLNYARLYKATNQPDSTIHYLNLVKNRVAEITYPYTRQAIYRELAVYYKNEGNTYEMDRFSKLQKKEEQLIQNMKVDANAQVANERFEHSKTINRIKERSNLKILIGRRYSTIVCSVYSPDGYNRLGKYRLKEKIQQLRTQQVIQKKSVLHFLLTGFWRTTNYAAFFVKNSITEEGELVGEKFRELGGHFIGQVAGSVKALFALSPKGVRALAEFTDEELCLTYLSWLEYPDDEINLMMGVSDVTRRQTALYNKLNEYGLKEQDLKAMFA